MLTTVTKAPECQPSLSLKLRMRVSMAPARPLVTRALCHAELHTSCPHGCSLRTEHPESPNRLCSSGCLKLTPSSFGILNDNKSPNYLNSSVFFCSVSLGTVPLPSLLTNSSSLMLLFSFPFFRSDLDDGENGWCKSHFDFSPNWKCFRFAVS